MGRLAALLRSAGGEHSLFPTLGRWMQAVSQALDANPAGAGLQYHIARRASTTQTIITDTDLVLNDVVGSVGGISYNAATGVWTLDANCTYELEFYAYFEEFDAAGDVAQAAWVDSSNGILLTPTGGTVGAFYLPGTSNIAASARPTARIIYATGAATENVKFRCNNSTGTIELSLGSYAMVRKIA